MPDCFSTDNMTGSDNLVFLQNFLKEYPELKDKDVWISGESYGGIYVPQLTYNIHMHNQKASNDDKINLKGMMVGNGVTNWTYDTTAAGVEFAYYRGLMDTETWDSMKANNCPAQYNPFATPSDICTQLLMKHLTNTKNIDIYNIYGKCWGASEAIKKALGSEKLEQMIVSEAGEVLQATSDGRPTVSTPGYFTKYDYSPWLKHFEQKKDNLKLTPPCVYSANIDAYLRDADVINALHIPQSAPDWQMCVEWPSKQFDYAYDPAGSQWIWEALAADGSYKLLKYSGDMDMAVPTMGTENWINNMNMNVKSAWRQYNYTEGTVGGYMEDYDGGITFASVHGAGHMVPQDQPEIAFWLISKFIDGTLPQ